MKKIDTTPITDAAQMTVKQGTLDHIQSAYQEMGSAILANIAQANTLTSITGIIYGCRLTISGGNYTVTEGAILYNGEVFLVDAVASTANPSGGNTRIAKIVTTFLTAANADPVTFTDGSNNNVHQIRKIVIENGTNATSGYIADYANIRRLSSSNVEAGTDSFSGTYTFSLDGNRNLVFGNATAGVSSMAFNVTNAMIGSVQRFSITFANADSLVIDGSVSADIEWILPTGTEFFSGSLPAAVTFSTATDVVGEITYLGYISGNHRIAIKLYGV